MKKAKGSWTYINSSVQGASHIRKNVPCQDYSLCLSEENAAYPVILSLSDGHGGSRYVRSAQGAVFACEAALSVASEYITTVLSTADANVIKQLAETRLKVDIVKNWQSKVFSHAEKHPFTDDELVLMETSRNITDTEKTLSAYGATLLLVIILEEFIICEQLGDGDILFYKKTGEESVYSPLEKDDTLFANETTSLCSTGATFYFRHSVTYLYDRSNVPDLIMLTSDGYGNSFSSTKDYFKTASDYYALIKEEGRDFIEENIEKWLAETTENGSGDDITIVLAWQ